MANVTDSPLFYVSLCGWYGYLRIEKNMVFSRYGPSNVWESNSQKTIKNLQYINWTAAKVNPKDSLVIFFLLLLAVFFFFLLHLLSEFAPNQFSMVSSDECPSRNPYWSFPASRFGDSLPGFRINSPVQFMHLIYVTVNHMWNIIFVKLEGDEQILLMAEILHQLRLVVSPIMFTVYRVLYVTGGAGFLPSTVLKS